MNNKIALVLYASVLSVSCALAQDAGLITHGAEVVEEQGGFGFWKVRSPPETGSCILPTSTTT